MTDHPTYPGYDVMAKRDTLSFNEVTREVLDRRLAVPREPRFFTSDEFATLEAVCDRILPQPADREDPVPLAAYVDEKMFEDRLDGYRNSALPHQGDAWCIGLAALDRDALNRYGARFRDLSRADRDGLLRDAQAGRLDGEHWRGMKSDLFFDARVIHDIGMAYYAHPTAWNEMGFGGPASPRGYVRMDKNRRDPWEAAAAEPGREGRALEENRHVV